VADGYYLVGWGARVLFKVKVTWTDLVLYILIFIFLDSKLEDRGFSVE